ncbi:histidinol-phosphate transaminase [Halocella sp. SP3-1]|uniref:histidinol-phosphate transaminase n=1 Tax=Halocella sp. SP3-1 TaxID=2382161 RepID=UPI000F752D64|nr:histidinol-phosphate transaminase [Halocella sp. SP3-1]AZO93156.1 histidinol-phosphate transaminase [Halocella sp. SP3-1]
MIGIDVKDLMRKELNKLKPYIPGKPIDEVKKEFSLDKIVKLASNENPLRVSEQVKKAVAAEMEVVNRYPDGACRTLKGLLADKLSINEEMILFGNGSDGLLKVIAEAFLTAEDEVIISHPTFVEYVFVSHLMGSQLVRICMDDYRQNLRAIAEAVTAKTKMIFLTNPHNPAGTIFSRSELDNLLETLPEGTIVVMDEAYYEYVQDENYPDGIEYIQKGYPIIVLRTFSKAYGLAGLRLGYAVAGKGVIEILRKARDPFNVNRIVQAAARAALKDTAFLEKSLQINEKGKEYLYQELNKRGIEYVPTEANFMLINLKMDSMGVFQRLLEMGLIIRPGKPLGYPEHIRLSIGLPEENKYFINCIDILRS